MINKTAIIACIIKLPLLLTVSLIVFACDRQVGGENNNNNDVVPLLVEQATRGRFSIERRFIGVVRPVRSVSIVVQEPGEVVSSSTLPDGVEVKQGTVLMELRSPALAVDLDRAQKALDYRMRYRQRIEALASEGLESSVKVDEARADEAMAASNLRGLEERGARLTVRATAAGRLISRTIPPPGQRCETGLEVAKIIDPASVVIEVAIPHSWNFESHKISHAQIELTEGKTIQTKVTSLAPTSDPARGGQVLTLTPVLWEGLTGGASVAVVLLLADRSDALTVPIEALVSTDKGFAVYLAPAPQEVGNARRTLVVPGLDDGRRVIIEQGLEEGRWVALVGATGGNEILWSPRYVGVSR